MIILLSVLLALTAMSATSASIVLSVANTKALSTMALVLRPVIVMFVKDIPSVHDTPGVKY